MHTSCGVSNRESNSSGTMILGCHHPAAAGEKRPSTSRHSHRGASIHEQNEQKIDARDPETAPTARKHVRGPKTGKRPRSLTAHMVPGLGSESKSNESSDQPLTAIAD